MDCIELEEAIGADLTIMIFTEGTILKPRSGLQLYRHKNYVPIGDCVEIIKGWREQGADIVYCTSLKGEKTRDIAALLKQFGFTGSKLFSRSRGEKYRDLVEKIRPEVLIEDNCRSIGGSWQMCITKVDPEIKKRIISVVVDEFMGIDHLPRNLSNLIVKNDLTAL
jgi:hypothetical protein